MSILLVDGLTVSAPRTSVSPPLDSVEWAGCAVSVWRSGLSFLLHPYGSAVERRGLSSFADNGSNPLGCAETGLGSAPAEPPSRPIGAEAEIATREV